VTQPRQQTAADSIAQHSNGRKAIYNELLLL
jgi:hypothetical protein